MGKIKESISDFFLPRAAQQQPANLEEVFKPFVFSFSLIH